MTLPREPAWADHATAVKQDRAIVALANRVAAMEHGRRIAGVNAQRIGVLIKCAVAGLLFQIVMLGISTAWWSFAAGIAAFPVALGAGLWIGRRRYVMPDRPARIETVDGVAERGAMYLGPDGRMRVFDGAEWKPVGPVHGPIAARRWPPIFGRRRVPSS